MSGCAGAQIKQYESQIQELNDKISYLELSLKDKEQELDSLKDQLALAEQQPEEQIELKQEEKADIAEPKLTTEQIQFALTDAGFYNGPIDNKMGPKTIEAIKAFQKANNLKADGVVGPETLVLLKKYLKK